MLTFQTCDLRYQTRNTLSGKTQNSIPNQLKVEGLISKKTINYLKGSKIKKNKN